MLTLIEDSRQQSGKHELKHKAWAEQHVSLTRCKLPYGDYALPPKVAIDTKANMLEIAGNIGGPKAEHKRFIAECKKAQEDGCQLYILVENDEGIEDLEDVARWFNPRTAFSPNCIQGSRLAKAMHTIQERYGCVFMFCAPEDAADIIVDLLR
jgi:ribosome-associated protein